jgi:hypothetical protein
LREGGSLPALEADDDFKYVLKFKGAGHGVEICRELIGGEIARVLNLKCRNSFMLISMKLSDAVKPMKKFRIASRQSGTQFGAIIYQEL